MARALNYTEYATYGQTLLVAAFFSSILAFGLNQVIHLFLSQNKKKPEQVIDSSLFISLVVGLIGSIILFLTSNYFGTLFNNKILAASLKLYAVSIPLTNLNIIIGSILIYHNKIKHNALLLVLSNSIKVGLVIISIQYFDSLSYAIISIVISQIMQFILGCGLIKFSFFKHVKKKFISGQLKIGIPLGLTAIIGAAILYSDGFMVSYFLDTKKYAIYRAGAFEVPFIGTIYASISMILLPKVAELIQSNKLKELLILKKKAIMNSVFLIYPVLIFLLFNSYDIIGLYLGNKYQSSAIIFTIFNLTLIIRINDYSDILIAQKKTRSILLYYSIALLSNLVFNFVLIKTLGFVGAAIGTVLSISILAFLQLRKTVKSNQLKYSDFIDIKKVFLTILFSVLAALTLFVSTFLIPNSIIRLSISALVFFPTTYLYLLKKEYIAVEIKDKLFSKIPFLKKK